MSHPQLLSDEELIERVVFGDTPEGAGRGKKVLAISGGLGGLGSYVELRLPTASTDVSFVDLSASDVSRLAAALELGKRAARQPAAGVRIRSHLDVQRWALGLLAGLDHEEVWVLALRANQRILAEWCVARGGVHGCGLLPADVLRPVLRCAASAFILVHNHPSGDPTPSRDDVVMTRALHKACLAVGVTLVDHVVVSRAGSFSMAEACWLEGESEEAAAE